MHQQPHVYRTQTTSIRYLLALPPATASARVPVPLLVFLHGRGECGDDLDQLKLYGAPKLVEGADDFPMAVVSPQCPAGDDWTPHIDTLLSLVDDLCANCPISQRQVYLTGLSMGGRGCWRLALADPTRFAALAVICGRFDGAWCDLGKLSPVPIRIFHGMDDNVVSVSESERIYEVLNDAGADVKLTRYADVGHNAWDRAYADPDLWAWLSAQRRNGIIQD